MPILTGTDQFIKSHWLNNSSENVLWIYFYFNPVCHLSSLQRQTFANCGKLLSVPPDHCYYVYFVVNVCQDQGYAFVERIDQTRTSCTSIWSGISHMTGTLLIHWGLVTYRCVSKLGHYWFKYFDQRGQITLTIEWKYNNFDSRKCFQEISSAKWWPFWLGLVVVKTYQEQGDLFVKLLRDSVGPNSLICDP